MSCQHYAGFCPSLFIALTTLFLSSTPAWGQLSPVGGHHAAMGKGSGFGGDAVSMVGSYSTSIPLDLPAPRGDLSVPLSVVYTGQTRSGAAGSGWTVPIAYIYVSQTPSGRRPHSSGSVEPQVYLDMGSGSMLMVQTDDRCNCRYRPRAAEHYFELRYVGDAESPDWIAIDDAGRTYGFWNPGLPGVDSFWVLGEITDASGNNRVKLLYHNDPHGHCTTDTRPSSLEMLLKEIEYSHDGDGVPYHKIILNYRPNSEGPGSICTGWGGEKYAVLDHLVRDGLALTRMQLLNDITILASGSVLRKYEFSYTPDRDTELPRLASVRQSGKDGEGELPVQSFDYANASSDGVISFRNAGSFELPTTYFGRTFRHGKSENEIWHFTDTMLRDFTGDGLPDQIYPTDNGLAMRASAASMDGVSLNGSTTAVPNSSLHNLQGIVVQKEHTVEQCVRWSWFKCVDVDVYHYLDTVREVVDWNGNGRLDIIEVDPSNKNRWIAYLNLPGTGDPNEIVWDKKYINISYMRKELNNRGHLHIDRLPLSRSRTHYGSRVEYALHRWYGEFDPATDSYIEHWTIANPREAPDEGKTAILWRLADVNGDGQADFLFNSTTYKVEVGCVYTGGSPCGSALEKQGQTHDGPAEFWGHANEGTYDITRWNSFVVETPNSVRVFYNVSKHNANGTVDVAAFSSEDQQLLATACPLELWKSGVAREVVPGSVLDERGYSTKVCGFEDVNGDGIMDFVEDRLVRLNDGRPGGFKPGFNLPGPAAVLRDPRLQRCEIVDNVKPDTWDDPIDSWQQAGLVDLTGDGLVDYVYKYGSGRTYVQVGTGAGFTPLKEVEGVNLRLSWSRREQGCPDPRSVSYGGLVDLDGDSRPSYVEKTGAGQLAVFAYTSSAALVSGEEELGPHDAGRLVRVDNGYGGGEKIRYGNAKLDGFTTHQTPTSEIVVTKIVPTGQSDPLLEPLRFAYGNISRLFDPATEQWQSTGYGLRVSVRGRPDAHRPDHLHGLALFEVAIGKDEVDPGSYDRVRVGQVASVFALEGLLFAEPRQYLAWQPTALGLTSGIYLEHSTEELSGLPAVKYQYGYLRVTGQKSWRGRPGVAAYGSQFAVSTNMEVPLFAESGHPTFIRYHNDIQRLHDDVCEMREYAEPTSDIGPRNRPSVVRLHACPRGAPRRELLRVRYEYDHLPAGQVSRGLVSRVTVTRFNITTGAQLSEFVAGLYNHDWFGNVTSVTRTQADGKFQQTIFSYDDFGVAVERVFTSGNDITTALEVTIQHDPVTLLPTRVTDPNGLQRETRYDSFGRPTQTRLGETVLAEWRYTDAAPRSVTSRTFHDWTSASSWTEQKAYVDALGRVFKTVVFLGNDYGGKQLVTEHLTYDSFGRPAFRADPHAGPEALSESYGTSFHYDDGGRLFCNIQGTGPQPLNFITDRDNHIYPSCIWHVFADHTEAAMPRGPNELDGASPEYGAYEYVVMSAIGQVLRRSRFQGGEQEKSTFEYDPLGNMTLVRRTMEGNPQLNILAAQADWHYEYDSFGRLLKLTEPESNIQQREYDDWGQLVKATYVDDGGVTRGVKYSYDDLGRLLQTDYINGDPYNVRRYFFYDVPSSTHFVVNSDGTPSFEGPMRLRGRLAWIDEGYVHDAHYQSNRRTYFSYDLLGRTSSVVWEPTLNLAGGQRRFGEGRAFGPSGILESLGFFQPDGEAERVNYLYDSAMRMTKVSRGSTSVFEALDIDEFGRYGSIILGNGVREEYTYRPTGRREPWVQNIDWGTGFRRTEYRELDGEGRLLESIVTLSADGSADINHFEYDEMKRLSRQWRESLADSSGEEPGEISADESFSYDGLGNLVKITDAFGSNSLWLFTGSDPDQIFGENISKESVNVQQTHLYDIRGNVKEIQGIDGHVRRFYYDQENALGKIESDDAFIAWLAWDSWGRLRTISELEHEGGQWSPHRTQRWFGSLMEEDEQHIEDRRVWTLRIPGPLGTVASIRRNPDAAERTLVYEHGDGIANRIFTDGTGNVVQRVDYGPYGQVTSNTGEPSSMTYSENMWNGGRLLQNYGITMLGARPYDARTGRFLQRDPLGLIRGAGRTNPYAFAFNDPVNYNDPSGLDPYVHISRSLSESSSTTVAINMGIGIVANYFGNIRRGGASPPTAAAASGPFPGFQYFPDLDLEYFLENVDARGLGTTGAKEFAQDLTARFVTALAENIEQSGITHARNAATEGRRRASRTAMRSGDARRALQFQARAHHWDNVAAKGKAALRDAYRRGWKVGAGVSLLLDLPDNVRAFKDIFAPWGRGHMRRAQAGGDLFMSIVSATPFGWPSSILYHGWTRNWAKGGGVVFDNSHVIDYYLSDAFRMDPYIRFWRAEDARERAMRRALSPDDPCYGNIWCSGPMFDE